GRVVAARPEAILDPTVAVGGGVAERFAHVPPLAAAKAIRMGVLDPGSVNLGSTGDDGLPGPVDVVYANSYGDIRYVLDQLEREGLGPSISIFEPGFLRTALVYHRAGRLPRGAFVKLYFGGDQSYLGGPPGGITFGLPPTRRALEVYLEMLEGCELPWAVAVLGGDVVASGLARLALERGGDGGGRLGGHGSPGGAPAKAGLGGAGGAPAREGGGRVGGGKGAARLLRQRAMS